MPSKTFSFQTLSVVRNPKANVLVSRFENGSEQRRKKGSRAMGTFRVRSLLLRRSEAVEWYNFFFGASGTFGALESFNYSPSMDRSGDGPLGATSRTYTCRMKEDSFRQTFDRGMIRIDVEFQILAIQ